MSLKKSFKDAYQKIRFYLSSNNSFIFIWNYKYFFHPKEGSLAYYLDLYSKHKKGQVTIIQVGANDGMTHDPVHKFIKRDNWKGVLLEPQKYVYEKFLSKIYSKNPGISTVNAAMGEKDGFLSMYKIGFNEDRWASGLTTFNKEVLEKQFESGYVAAKAKANKVSVPEDRNQWIVEEKVEVLSFNTLLDRYKLNKVHLLQIDTEGFDYEVIKMVNFGRIKPDLIIYESAHFSEAIARQCHDYLSKQGYVFRKIGGNTLCVHETLSFLTSLIILD